MLAIFAILVLLLTPLVMLVLNMIRPSFAYSWLVAATGALLAWPMLLLARPAQPYTLDLPFWRQGLPLYSNPVILVDTVSWAYSLGMATLALAVILTAVARPTVSWQAWASSLALAGLSALAALAGNPVTLLSAWAALDLLELVILLSLIQKSEARERVVVAFSSRVAGIVLLVWAVWQGGTPEGPLTFGSIPPQAALIMLLAAGLRLGVLPLHVPFLHEIPFRRGLGTILRVASPAAALGLLARIAATGIDVPATPILLALTGLAALYGSWSWMTASSELTGRPFWILAATALSLAAAVNGQPAASLAWGLATVLPGGLIFLASARSRPALAVLALGGLAFSALPFTPAWEGARLFSLDGLPLALLFSAAHILLLAGFARHSLRSEETLPTTERYVKVLYPLGLGLIPLGHFIITWGLTSPQPVPLGMWAGGAANLGLAGLAWYMRGRNLPDELERQSFWTSFFSLNWLYGLLWMFYRWTGRLMGWLTGILEGEGGLLWAMVLLALVFSVLSQSGSQGWAGR